MSAPGAALITGGAKRIGRAIAEALGERGYALAIHYGRSTAEAQALVEALSRRGLRAAAVCADLADPDAVAALVPAAAASVGPLTLLVNSASEFEPDEMGTLERARFERQLAVNLTAPVFLTEAFARQLPEGRDGCVINVLDQRVWRPTPRFVSYTLAKSALWMATRTMAQALAPRIRVNAVGPGPTLANPRQSEDDFARQAAAVPLGRAATPAEIANAVLYLTAAQSVTGQMIAVDGGQHLAWRTPDVEGIAE
ncbi:SDR family oxidoreductase [Blastochloris sulfoviridis]|uniref:SDR family oxidoreductase n=1 Tax=Blastochloris sulfoviridis TaxID=50712 RepID=A0A5M6I246_9HYPH|nr:SDR family oxidoreductase [Blastochloris sulfoviridis]KAA5602223.1 SDR family oxidoreductase [Blastochloris sulfoviridis]